VRANPATYRDPLGLFRMPSKEELRRLIERMIRAILGKAANQTLAQLKEKLCTKYATSKTLTYDKLSRWKQYDCSPHDMNWVDACDQAAYWVVCAAAFDIAKGLLSASPNEIKKAARKLVMRFLSIPHRLKDCICCRWGKMDPRRYFRL
jgi:hypothetical protein